MTALPPGQYELAEFPRFGLPRYAGRRPGAARARLEIRGDVESPRSVDEELRALPRVKLVADLHCVTTWSFRSIAWGGVRFADFYQRVVVPVSRPRPGVDWVVFHCQDGYAPSLPLQDLLAPEVLLADTMNGGPIPIDHGAPLRLVAPAHYGYKSAKHLQAVELRRDRPAHRGVAHWLIDHPRARVALEERGRIFPGWLLRYAYRPLVRPTIRRFREASLRG